MSILFLQTVLLLCPLLLSLRLVGFINVLSLLLISDLLSFTSVILIILLLFGCMRKNHMRICMRNDMRLTHMRLKPWLKPRFATGAHVLHLDEYEIPKSHQIDKG